MSGLEIQVRPLLGLPEVREGDNLGALVASAAPTSADVVVISQKVVSKAEGRLVRLDAVSPGESARRLARTTGKDPRLVQLVLDESRAVLRAAEGVLIAETRHGWVCANAGIDASNLEGEGWVALLPDDADASARSIRAGVGSACGARPAIVIADSFGRAWRLGQAEVAIGCAGLLPIDDWRGRADAAGRELTATAIATADQIAGAADLARGKDSGIPGAVVSGLGHLVIEEDGPGAQAIRRPRAQDLFR